METEKFIGISATGLKLLALVTMTIDHIGFMFFPGVALFRIIGRLAYPIFSFMIAEGCRYTRSKKKYFLSVFLMALLCQVVYFIADGSLYMCVLVNFSMAILIIYAQQAFNRNRALWWMPALLLLGLVLVCGVLPERLAAYGFRIDYGFCGVLLPVIISQSREPRLRLALTALGLVMVALPMGGVQWWGLLALFPLALYNGKPGRLRLKYFFYLYYPLHLAALEGVYMLLH